DHDDLKERAEGRSSEVVSQKFHGVHPVSGGRAGRAVVLTSSACRLYRQRIGLEKVRRGDFRSNFRLRNGGHVVAARAVARIAPAGKKARAPLERTVRGDVFEI